VAAGPAQIPSYSDPALPIAPGLTAVLVDFLKGIPAQ
jgi:hypothetical protein